MTDVLAVQQRMRKVEKSDTIHQHIVFRMSLFTTIADRSGKLFFHNRFGITLREYRIMGVIDYSHPISVLELSKECFLDTGQVSRVVLKLVGAGYVDRIRNGRKAERGGLLQLTAKGKQLLADALAYGDELNAQCCAVLSDEELELFSNALDKMIISAKNHYEQALKGQTD